MTTDVRERHRPVTLLDEEHGPFDFCKFCDYTYPCDAIVMADERDQQADRADEWQAIADRLSRVAAKVPCDCHEGFVCERCGSLIEYDRVRIVEPALARYGEARDA